MKREISITVTKIRQAFARGRQDYKRRRSYLDVPYANVILSEAWTRGFQHERAIRRAGQ